MNIEERWNCHVVEPAWLEDRLDMAGGAIAVVDMRGSVVTETTPDGEQTAAYLGAKVEYLEEHIPGAVYIDWTSDIADTMDPIPAQVANNSKICELFGALGIGEDTCIVAYDSHPSMQFATRLWWVCRYYGHANVRVLNGGWHRWRAEGRPVSGEIPLYAQRVFTPRTDPAWIATSSDVLSAIGDPEVIIVDARDEGQYSGKIRRGKRGGHIPGALHLPREAIFEAPGQLRPTDELRRVIFEAGIALNPNGGRPGSQRIIAYCNGGVAATSVLFALSILGNERLSNYDGSWNEWNLDPSLPIEPAPA